MNDLEIEQIKSLELATDQFIASGEWREGYEEFCIDVLKAALNRHGTQYLYDFSKKGKTEELLFNIFEIQIK